MFARFGLPDVLVTDNGPQFASAEFAVFARKKGITHLTSSPHYAQSNGKSENAEEVFPVREVATLAMLDDSLSDGNPETQPLPVVPDVSPGLRRSVRERKPAAWLSDYVSA